MKRISIIILFGLTNFHSVAQNTTSEDLRPTASSVFTDSLAVPNTDELEGLWHRSWTKEYPAHPGEDAFVHTAYFNTFIYMEGDSLWTLDFPCKRQSVEAYAPESFRLKDSSTIIYNHASYRRLDPDSTDLISIRKLKKHSINPLCYVGSWELLNPEYDERDGSGVAFVYPFDVADTLIVTGRMVNGNIIELTIEGVKKEFHFELDAPNSASYPVSYDHLILTPTNSWLDHEKLMWYRLPHLPPPNKTELKEIRQSEPVDVELYLHFRKL